jgi:DNA-binding HxlR family transcriptional regulator
MESIANDDAPHYITPMEKQAAVECPVAQTLRVIGSSWTCLILRDLLLHGPRRFQDFMDSLDGIASTTLSERLKALEQNGIVGRRFYSMSPPRAEYMLTDKGRDLGPIVAAMRDWGTKYAS